VAYDIEPIERYIRGQLTERDRKRFDRAKRFVDEAARRGGDDATAHRMSVRWLKFLCGRKPIRDVRPKATAKLRDFATILGLPRAETREFLRLGLLGREWRAWRFQDLLRGPPELVARLTRVVGWEYFEDCRRDDAGLILLPVHTQFSRLVVRYLRHRGHVGLMLGLTDETLDRMGFTTPSAKQFELARQMHAAKHLLRRGGIVFNAPDSPQHLDSSRSVEFFGRQRKLATGFAELALTTGAHVVPLAHRFSPRGFFILEFGAPFHALGPPSTHDERVDSLVGQYAGFLRDHWRRYPWDIQWGQLRRHGLLPATDVDSVAMEGAAEPEDDESDDRDAGNRIPVE
jgi:KDO2-lipid IV(A) lauroyltransferase